MKPQIELKRTQLSNSRHFIWLVYFSIIISIILLSSNTVEAQYNPFTTAQAQLDIATPLSPLNGALKRLTQKANSQQSRN